MIINSSYNKNNTIPLVKNVVIIKRSITTLRCLGNVIKGTYLMRPLSIKITKRFSGNNKKGPDLLGKMSGLGKGTPMKPSSLAKPLPPEPKPMSPKHYNHGNVGGMTFKAPYDPSKDSYQAKPGVMWAVNKQQTYPPSALPNSKGGSSNSNCNTFITNTHTTTSSSTPFQQILDEMKDSNWLNKDNKPATSNNDTTSTSSNLQVTLNSNTTTSDSNTSNTMTTTISTQSTTNSNNTIASSNILQPTPLILKVQEIQKQLLNGKILIPKNTKIPNLMAGKDKSFIEQEIRELSKKLSEEDVILELAGRGFVKVATDNKTQFKTISDETIVVGNSKNGIKITPFGVAYIKKVTDSGEVSNEIQVILHKEEYVKYQLGALVIEDNTFLSTGSQKHVVVVYDVKQNSYYSIGYLTSQSSSNDFAQQQFKSFQKARENNKEPSTMPQSKPQRFTPFDRMLLIKDDQLKILKWSTDYMQNLDVSAQTYLKELQKNLEKKPLISYDATGYSKELLIQACISFNDHVKKNLSHPKTTDEILNEQKKAKIKPEYMAQKAIKKLENQKKWYPAEKTTPFNE